MMGKYLGLQEQPIGFFYGFIILLNDKTMRQFMTFFFFLQTVSVYSRLLI